jgi:hypothetical protein
LIVGEGRRYNNSYVRIKCKMNIQKLITIISFTIISSFGLAQQVDLISKGDYIQKKKIRALTILSPRMDTSQLKFVATFKATGRDSTADWSDDLYVMVKKKAIKLGANSYKLREVHKDTSNTTIMTFDTYFASESLFKINESFYERNVVYVFADLIPSDKTFSLNVNGTKKVFKAGTFLKLEIKEGEELSLNKGGLTGATRSFNYEENQPATYLTVTGFGLGGGQFPRPGAIGLSFNTGRLMEYNPDNGELLIQILKQSE